MSINCLICGHAKEMHMQVCGDRDCDCLCFLGAPLAEEVSPSNECSWQETAIMAAFDLIMQMKEGSVYVKAHDGKECLIKVSFLPNIGYVPTKVGEG